MRDLVNHPAHYTEPGKLECIDYMRERLSDEEFVGLLYGNLIKYSHRWKYKNGVLDLQKARWYLDRLINELESEVDNVPLCDGTYCIEE